MFGLTRNMRALRAHATNVYEPVRCIHTYENTQCTHKGTLRSFKNFDRGHLPGFLHQMERIRVTG